MRVFFQALPEKEILSTPLKDSQTSISIDDIGSSLLSSVPTLSAMLPLTGLPICGCSRFGSREAKTHYETEAIRAGWSVRQSDRQIGSEFCERIAPRETRLRWLKRHTGAS